MYSVESSGGPLVALPDLSAFDHESSIEKKKRQKRLTPTYGGAYPHTPSSLSSSHGAAAAYGGVGGGVGLNAVPVHLSSSHGRPVCPSTPMKSPSTSKLFHAYNTYTPQPHARALSGGAGLGGSAGGSRDASFASSLNSSRGSSEHNSFAAQLLAATTASNDTSLSLGSPELLFGEHACSGSPVLDRSARRPTSLSSSLGRGSSLVGGGAGDSRFGTSFYNFGEIGRGSFGACFHVADSATGAEYAVKKSLRAYRGENDRAGRRREVENLRRLMAAAGNELTPSTAPGAPPTPAKAADATVDPVPRTNDHRHLVQFHSAWEEAGSLYIQTELLTGGTVRNFLDTELKEPAEEALLWLLLLDLSRGLRFVHERAHLAHLDLKWENTFIATSSGQDAGLVKIGDFGSSMDMQERAAQTERAAAVAELAIASPIFAPSRRGSAATPTAAVASGTPGNSFVDDADFDFNAESLSTSLNASSSSFVPDVEEGDCVYLAPEFLESSLLEGGMLGGAADIFSLGLMMLEATCDVDLPKHGQDFQDLRSGPSIARAKLLDKCFQLRANPVSDEMRQVIEAMLARRPRARPTAAHLLTHPRLVAAARGDGEVSKWRSMLRALPSVLPTARHLKSSRGAMQVEAPLVEASPPAWLATSHDDVAMTPMSQRSSPMAPVTGRKRAHVTTPTALAFSLAGCTTDASSEDASSPMRDDDALALPLPPLNADLSSSLFSSASYSSSSSRASSGGNSTHTPAPASLFVGLEHDARESGSRGGSLPHLPGGPLADLARSTRRTASQHTSRAHHALALHQTQHGLRVAAALGHAPIPIAVAAPAAAAPEPIEHAHRSLHSSMRRRPSPAALESESEAEESLPARNLFASFQGADDDDE